MPPSLAALKLKFTELFISISEKLDTKLDKTTASVSADRLTNPITLTLKKDIIGSVSISGNSNVSIDATLPSIATAGTYPKVTINVKGQVIGGEPLLISDLPALDASNIGTGVFSAARIPVLDASKVGTGVFNAARIPLPTKLAANRTISATGDATWSVGFDGSQNATAVMTFKDSGVTAGIYGAATQIPKLTIDSKGRVTAVELIDVRAQTALVVNEFITAAADSLKQYDLQTLLGAGYVNFDLKTAEISVRAKDTNASSPMFNSYANAEALVSYGIRDNRYVLIANQSGGPIDLYVKILVHPI